MGVYLCSLSYCEQPPHPPEVGGGGGQHSSRRFLNCPFDLNIGCNNPQLQPISSIISTYTKRSYFMFQTKLNLTDTPRTEYNGWSDWTTWNCALWIGGDEGLYNIAKDCERLPRVFTIHSRSI